VRWIADLVTGLRADVRELDTRDGPPVPFDALLLALGACPRPALPGAIPFAGPCDVRAVAEAIDSLSPGRRHVIALVAAAGTAWTLPLYVKWRPGASSSISTRSAASDWSASTVSMRRALRRRRARAWDGGRTCGEARRRPGERHPWRGAARLLLGKGKQLAGGESDVITADLKPGAYELVCFLPGHYSAGQKIPFEVTD
jgi:hypothetical protein